MVLLEKNDVAVLFELLLKMRVKVILKMRSLLERALAERTFMDFFFFSKNSFVSNRLENKNS